MARTELNQITHTYDTDVSNPTYALEEFSITRENGGRYAILGPSRCGKTAMLNIMSGIVHPTRGRILFDGVDVTATDISNRNIAQVFQFPVIYNTMTVQENLAFPLVCRGVSNSRIKEKVN
ncbi:MAG: ATP-binding cassette domain-containing protein [SAR324 cluster bacterium]|nr:ATP-binding cassette domain-containing protein [SAR324 cluster bacterium]